MAGIAAWLEQRGVPWQGFDLDPDHRTFSRLYPEATQLVELGDEPEGDVIKVLRKLNATPVTLIDPRAHLSATVLKAWDIDHILSQLPTDGLKAFRTQHKLTPEMMRTVIEIVSALTQQLMRDYSGFDPLPPANDAVYSFPLRFALANTVVALHWAKKSGIKHVDAKRLRNDITDASYVAYATFYDGLVTRDGKMEENYVNTCNLLPVLFGVQTGC